MKIFFTLLLVVLILASSVTAYFVITEDDNEAVKEFKAKTNLLALKNDIEENEITPEALNLKLKYFWRDK